MANQYSTFAELFDEAIRSGLPAVQTQHPGYYFQLAAHHAGLRHSSAQELCKVNKPCAIYHLLRGYYLNRKKWKIEFGLKKKTLYYLEHS